MFKSLRVKNTYKNQNKNPIVGLVYRQIWSISTKGAAVLESYAKA